MRRLRILSMAAMFGLSAAVIAAASLHAAPGGPKPLPPKDRQYLLNDKFKVSYASSALPAPVRTFYTSQPSETPDGGKAKFPMAEPGQPWNNTDAVRDASLPFRRLIFVAVSYDYCIVAYERGGIAYSRNATLFHLTGKKSEMVWSGNILGDFKTLHDLRVAIKTNKYRDGGWQ